MVELQKWRKQAATKFWLEEEVEEDMPDSLFVSDTCLQALAKSKDLLTDEEKIQSFLQLWYGVEKHSAAVLACFQQANLQTKTEKRSILQSACASKKMKFMDNPTVAEAARITQLRDNWLI